MNLFAIVMTLTFILVPSLALISSSQSNDTFDEPLSNETSFSSLSRELAENQSQSADESDQETDD